MPNVLITGGTGFVGSHLIEFILKYKPEYKIYATRRRRSDMDNVRHINSSNLVWIDCDLEDAKSIRGIFEEGRKFEKCFHLAAQSFVKLSWEAPTQTLYTNIFGTLNLLEAFREFNKECVIQIAGSSEEYGFHDGTIDEKVSLLPMSPYAVSKVAQENLGYQYFKSYGLKTVLTRTFNHEGPRRGESFVTSSFAKQIVEIEKKKKEPIIYHGNLESYRDYTDVRDVVRAYWWATEMCDFGEPYNICSGKSVKIEDMLDMLIKMSTNEKIEKKQDPSRMRPSDLTFLQGDNTKFCKKTGWAPEITVQTMLSDLLDYWRIRI